MTIDPAVQRILDSWESRGYIALSTAAEKILAGKAITSADQENLASAMAAAGVLDQWRATLLTVKPIAVYSTGTDDLPVGMSVYVDPRETSIIDELKINVADALFGDDSKQRLTSPDYNDPESLMSWLKIAGVVAGIVGIGWVAYKILDRKAGKIAEKIAA